MSIHRATRRSVLAGGAVLAAAAPHRQSPVLAAWRDASLRSGTIRQLVVDAAGQGIVFAITQASTTPARSNLYKSMDAGKSWLSLERGLPAGFQPTALAVALDDSRTLLVSGTEGVFRSQTGGGSWSRVPPRLPALTALSFDRENPRVVLAGTELEGNFRSEDGGLSWRPAARGLPRDRYGVTPGAVLFAQHPRDHKTLLMATNGFGVYRTEDGGLTWSESSKGLPRTAVRGLAFGTNAPDTVFALQANQLCRSADAGGSWQTVSGLGGGEYAASHVDPVNRDHVYVAGVRGALFRSTNGAVTWAELPSLRPPVRALVTWAAEDGLVLGGAAGEGVWQLRLVPTLPASPAPAGPGRAYFPETGHNVSPTFHTFFQSRGGLERFGYPRTEEMIEDGLLVQYFQRGRLQLHPEHRGTPFEVQISLLGERLIALDQHPPQPPFESSVEQRYFEQTGHSVSYAFLRYFDARGGADSFGYPITEELQEAGQPAQYFQRARLEYRADRAGTRDEVVVGLIGDQFLRQRRWLD